MCDVHGTTSGNGWRTLLAAVLTGMVSAGAAAAPAAAQVGSVVRGEVTGPAGEPVAGARVIVEDRDGERVASTETDPSGRYLLVGVPAEGPYGVRVEALGMAPFRLSGLRFVDGESRRLDIVLETDPVMLEGIRVTAAPALVFSGTRTGSVTLIEERVVESLPAIHRDITSFAVLSPMVSVDRQAISVAGQNSRLNALRVDGAVSQDVFGLSPSGVPGGQANAKALPLDAIRQYSVLVAPYDVRQSGFTGGLLNAVTHSGGDRWGGEAFAYYRDDLFGGTSEDVALRTEARGPETSFAGEIAGFTLGGPVGSARLFVAGEVERQRRPVPGFNLGESLELRTKLSEDSVARVRDILSASYGLDAGETGGYTIENPLGNLFGRLDLPVGERHDLMLRYNWIAADEDLPPNRLGFGAYELGSSATRIESRTHGAMARIESRLGPRTTNEAILNVQLTTDRTHAASDAPQVEVWLGSDIEEERFYRHLQAGGAPLAHDDALDQTVIQFVDNLSHAAGDHLLTVGVEGTVLGARRRFLPASRGIWRFNSIGALEANEPSSYERLVLADGKDPAVDVRMLQLGTYLQDEWSLTGTLSLSLGLRLDVPLALGSPGYNEQVEVETGIVTDRVPSGTAMLSPRLGFNWSPDTERRTQVRGGVGLFTGTPPLAWLADAYTDTGLRTGFLLCEGDQAPPLDIESPPRTCGDGSAPLQRNVTFLDEGFRYPQDLRGSVALDRELPGGLVASVEVLYTRALNQVALEDINLPVADTPPYDGPGHPNGLGGRGVFGTPLVVPTRFSPYQPRRRWDTYGSILRVGNRSRNAALAVAGELTRRFSDRLDLRASYTYTRGVDVRSLLYQSAALNYGMTPVRGDPARPDVRPSAFARPHRVLGSVWTRLLEWGDGLDASLVYVGQSGTPYTYVYATDMNGDGFPGPGALTEAYNDPLFVPERLTDVPGGSLGTINAVFQLVGLESCLSVSRGAISVRNQCRTPWSNRLDIQLSQGLNIAGGSVRITADVMNVLNLLNGEWGLVQTAPPVVPVLAVTSRLGCPGLECSISNPVNATYVGPQKRNPETGGAEADLPYVLALPESLWRAQFGVRIGF